ncbi:MAG: peptidylprolyl isomerase [Flavobacterium sp.]
MAVLSKIRQRSGLLLVVIGFCLFAFIIGDLVQGNLFNQSSRNVGSVNNKDISFDEFKVKVDNVEKSGQGVTPTQAVNQVWDQEVSIALLTSEFEKLGINVGEIQIVEILKQSEDIGQNPQFLNAAGVFDLAKFKEFFKANPEQAQLLKEREKSAELNAKYQIYSTLVKAGVYTTKSEAKLKYEMENNKVNFDFVSVPYSSVKDSDVKISDEEIVAYMKKNEKKFKADANSEIEFVVVEDKASAADEADVKNAVNAALTGSVVYNQTTGKNDTLPGFKNARNIADFVNSNSDVPYDSTFVSKRELPAEHADQLFALPTGGIYGPYMFNGYYAVSKSMGKQAGATAKASHILLAYKGAMRANPAVTRTKEEALAKATEIMNQVQANPSSFMMLAFSNSDDSSKQQGGDLGYFSKGQMTKKFNDFVFGNPIGKIGLIETEFGYHVINITDKQDAIRLATIARKIEPSQATSDAIFIKAQLIEQEAQEKALADVAKANGLTVTPSVKVRAMDEMIGGLGNQRQIVKWANGKEAKIGEVKRFEVPNVGHVIVKLKKQNEEGLMDAADARPMVEYTLKNKKKAEMIIAKMKGSSLEAIASANKVAVQSATDVTVENAVLPGVGQEQRVVGTAFAIGTKISSPIEGMTGVYVVRGKNVVKAPALPVYTDYINKLKSQNASAAGRVIGALKTDAKIEDKRQLFF